MSNFTQTWQAVEAGIKRILITHDLPGEIEYSNRDNYDNGDLYVVIRVEHGNVELSEFVNTFDDEPVFETVAGTVKEREYSEKTRNKYQWNGPYDKFAFHIDLTANATPRSFHKEYDPVTFESIPGIGSGITQRLQDAGYSSPRDISQDDIEPIADLEEIGNVTLSGICGTLGLTKPCEQLDDDISSLESLTDAKVSLFKDAGFETITDLENAANEALLEISGVGSRTVWRVRDELCDADESPEICGYA